MTHGEKLAALGSGRTPGFCLTFSFPPKTRNPQRLLKAAWAYIDALQSLDALIVSTVDSKIRPAFVLEELEAGSLRFWMKQALEVLEDDALTRLDWKPQVCRYLVRAKYCFLELLAGKQALPSRDELEDLSRKIHQLAVQTDARRMPAYSSVKALELAREAEKISAALRPLEKGDAVTFQCDDGDAALTPALRVDQDQVNELFAETRISGVRKRVFSVRRPDFLGDAKWEFRYEGRTISAKITHQAWLEDYRAARFDIRPGDSLHVTAEEVFLFGKHSDVIREDYAISEVHAIVRQREQGMLMPQQECP